MRLTKAVLVLAGLMLLTIQTSCGVYGFRPKNPPEGIKTLAVPLFEDLSNFSEAGVRENFTERLKTLIVNDNTFYITDQTEADGLLFCTITSITDEPLVISGNETVAVRRISITVNVDFRNLKTQRAVWERPFSNWGEYSSRDAGFSERDQGINEAINKICEDILNDITSNW